MDICLKRNRFYRLSMFFLEPVIEIGSPHRSKLILKSLDFYEIFQSKNFK